MAEMEEINIQRFENIPLSRIEISESNVRKSRQRAGLEELKASIKRMGLIHPVIVVEQNGRYKLIVGQRRFLAFKDLDKSEIPALVIAPISSSTEKIVSFGENIHRTKLPYSDTIRVCDELFNTLSGDKFEKIQTIAQTLGISPQTVSKYLSYKLVPDEVQDMVNEKKLSASLAYRITSAFWPNTEKIVKIADYMTKMTKSEWERALDIGIKNPKSTVDDIIEEAKKPKITYEIRIILDAETHKLLNDIAKERNLEPATLVMNLINDFLESELND